MIVFGRAWGSMRTWDALRSGAKKRARRIALLATWVLLIACAALMVYTVIYKSYFENKMPEVDQLVQRHRRNENILVKPTFRSTDDHGNPYYIGAEDATRIGDALMKLTSPRAKFINQEKYQVTLKAQQGHYDQEALTLVLQENVKGWLNNLHKLTTTELHLLINDKVAYTHERAHIENPDECLECPHGLRYNHAKNTLLCFKGTKLSLKNSKTTVFGPQGMRCDGDMERCRTLGNKAYADVDGARLSARRFFAHHQGAAGDKGARDREAKTPKITMLKARGDVHYQREQLQLRAPEAHYNNRTGVLDLLQSVRVIDPEHDISVTGPTEYSTADSTIKAHGRTALKRGRMLVLSNSALIRLETATRAAQKKGGREKTVQGRRVRSVNLYHDVSVTDDAQILSGDRGVYDARAQIIEVHGTVTLSNDTGLLRGNYGYYDLATQRARIYNRAKGAEVTADRREGRVTSTLNPNTRGALRRHTAKKN